MADLRDEHGNPIQLADQYGNPVQLTDEYGNPMKLSGVAMTSGSTSALHSATAPVKETFTGSRYQEPRTESQDHLHRSSNPMNLSGVAMTSGSTSALHSATAPVEETFTGSGSRYQEPRTEPQNQLRRSSSSSSNSSEDDGQGGRKKKGLKEKIKEKFSSGKHRNDERVAHSAQPTITTTTTTGNATSTTTGGQLHPVEHEKKSMMNKIKEKLPGHH